MGVAMLYGPMVAALGLIATACLANFGPRKPFVEISKYNFRVAVSNTAAARVAFFTAGLSCLLSYLYIDVATLFPQYLEMEVFYDDAGVTENLRIFSQEELLHLGFKAGNETIAKTYYQELDHKLAEVLRYEEFFSFAGGVVHSKGDTTFKVVKTRGIQRYYIVQSTGALIHTLERPGKPPIQCEKLRSCFKISKLENKVDFDSRMPVLIHSCLFNGIQCQVHLPLWGK